MLPKRSHKMNRKGRQSKKSLRFEALESRNLLATMVWDGGGIDGRWMTAANWVGDVAPSPGDDLWFVGGALRKVNNNNFPAGTSFGSINFAGGGYTIAGARLRLTGNITALNSSGDNSLANAINFAGTNLVNNTYAGTNLKLTGPMVLSNDLTVDGSGNTTLSGVISGAAGVVKNGPGTLTQDGDNTYTGQTTINAGVLTVSGFGNPLGNETTGTVVQSGATLQTTNINDNMAEPLTLNGYGILGDTLGTTRGALEIGPPAFTTWTGPITLASDASIGVNHTGDFTVNTSPITLNGHRLSINGAGPAKLNSPIVDGVGGAGSLAINPAYMKGTEYGTVTSTVANTYTGATVIYSGVLNLSGNGSLASTDIQLSGAPGLGSSNGFSIPGGVLKLDNTTTLGTNRIPDSATVTLKGGALHFVGFNGASASTETIGNLHLAAGHAFVRSEANTNASANNQLTFASVTRDAGATVDFSGTGLGTSKNKILFTAAPTKVGSNGGILPYATLTGTVQDFATYAVATGIAPFTGYVTDLATATANDIALVTSSQTLSTNKNVTGLLIRDAGTNTTLTVSSGVTLNIGNALATSSTSTSSNTVSIVPGGSAAQLSFGTEGIVLRSTPTTIKTAISGNTSLTLSGTASLVLEPPAEGNTFTAGLTLNSGQLTINNKNTPFGNASGPLKLRGGVLGASVFVGAYSIANPLVLDDAKANFAAISTLSFTGSITLTGRNIVAVPGNVTLDFVGKVSGKGSLIVTAAMNSGSGGGTLAMSNANNDYSGGTSLANSGIFTPTLKLNGNKVLGTGPLFLSGGNLTAGALFSLAKPILMASSKVTFGGTNAITLSGTVNIIGVNSLSRDFFGGPSVTITGLISGSGAITKSGDHLLKLTAANTYTGSTLVTEGTLSIHGNQPNSAVGVMKAGSVTSRLMGTGTIGFLSASKGGIVDPGFWSTLGTLTASGANFSDYGILRLLISNDLPSGTDNDSLLLGTGRLIVGPVASVQFDLTGLTSPRDVLGAVKYGSRIGVTDKFAKENIINNPGNRLVASTYSTTDLNLTISEPPSSLLATDAFFSKLGSK